MYCSEILHKIGHRLFRYVADTVDFVRMGDFENIAIVEPGARIQPPLALLCEGTDGATEAVFSWQRLRWLPGMDDSMLVSLRSYVRVCRRLILVGLDSPDSTITPCPRVDKVNLQAPRRCRPRLDNNKALPDFRSLRPKTTPWMGSPFRTVQQKLEDLEPANRLARAHSLLERCLPFR